MSGLAGCSQRRATRAWARPRYLACDKKVKSLPILPFLRSRLPQPTPSRFLRPFICFEPYQPLLPFPRPSPSFPHKEAYRRGNHPIPVLSVYQNIGRLDSFHFLRNPFMYVLPHNCSASAFLGLHETALMTGLKGRDPYRCHVYFRPVFCCCFFVWPNNNLANAASFTRAARLRLSILL